MQLAELIPDRSGNCLWWHLRDGVFRFSCQEDPPEINDAFFSPDLRPFFKKGLTVYRGIDIRSHVRSGKIEESRQELNKILENAESSMRLCGIDPGEHSGWRSISPLLLQGACRRRMENLLALTQNLPGDDLRSQFIWALWSIEQAGIHINQAVVQELMKRCDDASQRAFLLTVLRTSETRFNPFIGRTGRIKTSGGISCMNIPKGISRSVVTSRWSGGKILSLDYNAIDYRCIISAAGDRLSKFYDGAEDFHLRTCSLLLGLSDEEVPSGYRDIVKAITYPWAYGGSLETVVEKFGVERRKVDLVFEKLGKILAPVIKLRETLYEEYLKTGSIRQLSGRELKIDSGSHPGKVLGIFAQGYSSILFESALTGLERFMRDQRMESRIIFPVHDEIVIDLHPEEQHLVPQLRGLMADPPGYNGRPKLAVKSRIGKDYYEATV